MYIKIQKKSSGFTLIEILVVIGLIAILATIVIIAINPSRQFAQGRNNQRLANVNALLNAIGQRVAENKGVFAGSVASSTCPTLTSSSTLIASGGAGDISCLVPTYLPTALPFDPSAAGSQWANQTSYNTGYFVSVDANGRYTISAPSAELGQTISVTR